MKKKLSICFLTIILIVFPQSVLTANDNDQDKPWEKLNIKLGGYIVALDSDVSIGSERLGIGASIDVEEALDLETSLSVFRAEALYRFDRRRRHQIDLKYFDFRRKATKNLTKDIEFRDKIYSIGTDVDSFFNIRVFKASYGYAFFQDDRFSMSASLGLFITPIEFGADADKIGSEDEDITAPLPVLGLNVDFALTPKLFIKQNIEFFYFEINDFIGTLTSANVALEYNAWKHLGLGIGYDIFRFRIESQGEDYPGIDFTGKIEFGYSGLLLYGKIYF